MAETQYLFPEGLFINKGIILENKTFSKIISKKKKKIDKITKDIEKIEINDKLNEETVLNKLKNILRKI